MISYKEALALIANEANFKSSRRVDRNEALGLIAAADVVAQLDVPSFDNSAMDGFALHGIGKHLTASKLATVSPPVTFWIARIRHLP